MNSFLSGTLFLMLVVAAVSSPATDAEPPDAQAILRQVVAGLPQDPVVLSGKIKVLKRRGVLLREMHFRMDARWGAAPPVVECTVTDLFGSVLRQVRISHVLHEGDPAAFSPMTLHAVFPEGAPPAMAAAIEESDLTWADLMFAFLWWPDAAVEGRESRLGRDCHVVRVRAPGQAASEYAYVRLWIDVQIGMLLQFEGYNDKDRRIKSMRVRSFKKMDDRWMLKEMDIEGTQAGRLTTLLVEQVEAQGGVMPVR